MHNKSTVCGWPSPRASMPARACPQAMSSHAQLPWSLPLCPQVVSEFIRSPDMFQFDLAANPAVVQLGSGQHAALHRLLTIFLTGTVQVRFFLCWHRLLLGWRDVE